MVPHDSPVAVTTWILDVTEIDPYEHVDCLTPSEAGRLERYSQEDDRRRFAVGASVIRLIAARELGQAASAVTVDRTCTGCGQPHGKPRLPDSDLQLSVSHSGRLVAIAEARGHAVGIDVEHLDTHPDADFWASVMSPGERARGHRERLSLWCRKEAVLKAMGHGLQIDMPRVRICAASNGASSTAHVDGQPLGCRVLDLLPRFDFAGAVAVLAPRAELMFGDALSLWSRVPHGGGWSPV